MKIRPEQMESFSEAAVQDFEDRMVVHLEKFFMEQCEALGEDEMRKAIREGIDRAAGHGITAERGVCKYIDLMFAFGRRFDESRELPWAQKILNDQALDDPGTKVDRLYDEGMEYVRQVADVDPEDEA